MQKKGKNHLTAKDSPIEMHAVVISNNPCAKMKSSGRKRGFNSKAIHQTHKTLQRRWKAEQQGTVLRNTAF